MCGGVKGYTGILSTVGSISKAAQKIKYTKKKSKNKVPRSIYIKLTCIQASRNYGQIQSNLLESLFCKMRNEQRKDRVKEKLSFLIFPDF